MNSKHNIRAGFSEIPIFSVVLKLVCGEKIPNSAQIIVKISNGRCC